jgi:O-antigen/teichoic acid export membrane protein
VYTIGTVAPILVTLLITPLVVRLLGTSQYGYVGISITTYQAVAVILPLGLPAAVTRHALIERSARAGAAGLVLLGAAVAVVIAIPVALTSPVWGEVLFGDVGWLLIWPVLSSIGLAWMALGQSMLRADDRARTFVGLGWTMAIMPPASALALCALSGADVIVYLATLAIVQVLVGAAAVWLSCRGARATTSAGEARGAVRIALPTVPHQLAMASLGVATVAIVTSTGGVAAGGQAQLAFLLGTAPLTILGALNNAWAPMVYRASGVERERLLRSTTAVVSLIALALTAAFCLCAPWLALVLVGAAQSAPLTSAALITAAGAGLMVLYLSNIHLVFASGRTSLLAVATPASLLISVVTASAVSAASGVPMLAVIVVPVFYLLQYVASVALRHLVGQPAPRVSAAVPAVAASALVPILAAAGVWIDGGGAVIAAVAIAAIGGGVTFLMWRRPQIAGRT